MATSDRGGRGWKILGLLGLIFVAFVLASYFWIQRVADRGWAEAEERIRQLQQKCPAPPRRLMIIGMDPPRTPGERFFQSAIERVRRQSFPELRQPSALVRERAGWDKVDPVLAASQEMLYDFHSGGRSAARHPEHQPEPGLYPFSYDVVFHLVSCSILRARRWRSMNASFDAAETLLDSCQLIRLMSAQRIGPDRFDATLELYEVLDELREIVSGDPLSPSQLRAIEEEMKSLEEAMPSPLLHLEENFARWAERLDEFAMQNGRVLDYAPYRWRYLLPQRLMKAQAFLATDRLLKRVLEDERAPYLDLVEMIRRANIERYDSTNPILRDCSFFNQEPRLMQLERKAQWRLLITAAQYRAGGEIADLADPYGDKLRHSKEPGKVRFWSLGSNGTDEGGAGNPTGPWGRRARSSKDLVVEVERRPEDR